MMRRAAWLLVALCAALAASGCGSGDGRSEPVAGAGGAGTGGSGGIAGVAGSGGIAGVAGSGGIAGVAGVAGAMQPSDAGTPRDAQSDADTAGAGGAGETDSGAPEAGGLLASCQKDSDCEGALICREGSKSTPGYCTNSCMSDGDCGIASAVCSRVSIPGACVLPCTADDACPADMACQALVDNAMRCAHPPPPAAERFARCSLSANNCESNLNCYRSSYSESPGPGYCTPDCASAADCTALQPSGVTAVLECLQGQCRFACETGACPDGMFCERMEPADIEPFSRCHFED